MSIHDSAIGPRRLVRSRFVFYATALLLAVMLALWARSLRENGSSVTGAGAAPAAAPAPANSAENR